MNKELSRECYVHYEPFDVIVQESGFTSCSSVETWLVLKIFEAVSSFSLFLSHSLSLSRFLSFLSFSVSFPLISLFLLDISIRMRTYEQKYIHLHSSNQQLLTRLIIFCKRCHEDVFKLPSRRESHLCSWENRQNDSPFCISLSLSLSHSRHYFGIDESRWLTSQFFKRRANLSPPDARQ